MRVIDSHTEGEPTRLIIEGGPELGNGPIAERALDFSRNHAAFRSHTLAEPRGHDAMVGALLCPPTDPSCATGVIFYNPVGVLGMCGHAAIGTIISLAYLGLIKVGTHRLETPVGTIEVKLLSKNKAAVENVESYRHRKNVKLDVTGYGKITGDIAWGGNWFFLTKQAPCALTFDNIPGLTQASLAIRKALHSQTVSGVENEKIDHIEFNGEAVSDKANGCNFVLCPGGAYDRSPCGTGTSAKIACLADDGLLSPGETWIQESIIGSQYKISYRPGTNGGVIPTIEGHAYVTGETILISDPEDPYLSGISPITRTVKSPENISKQPPK